MALCGIIWTCLLSLDKTNWHKTNGNAEYNWHIHCLNHTLDLVLTFGSQSEQLTVFPWTEEKFQCNLLVSLARILFFNWLYMNELDYFEIN